LGGVVPDHKSSPEGSGPAFDHRLAGSLVIEADRIDVDEIAEFASSQGLFEPDRKKPERAPLFKKVSNPVSALNAGIDKISGGDFNLPGLIFMVLLGFGAISRTRSFLRKKLRSLGTPWMFRP
jgi:hypothetical protein